MYKITGLIMRTAYYDILKDFSNEDIGKIFKTIIAFVNGENIESSLPTELFTAYNTIKTQIIKDNNL